MNIQTSAKLGARFRLVVHKGDISKPTSQTDWFNNLVLNIGLDRMSVGMWIDRCCVGTGNSTPVATQTALDSFLASTTSYLVDSSRQAGVQTTISPYYYWHRQTWRFNPGVATGNISEVGLGWGNTALWNRALIKDGAGDPTTITVLADEYLDVITELRVYPQETFSGSFDLKDKVGATISTHTYTGRSYLNSAGANVVLDAAKIVVGLSQDQMVTYSGAIGATVTSLPSGTSASSRDFTNTFSYPTARSCRTVAKYELTYGNTFAHRSFLQYVKKMLCGSTAMAYQWEISPTISKNNTQELTYTFTVSWDRYTP